MKKTQKKKNTILLIYNPTAGKKREIVGKSDNITIEYIQFLLKKYLLSVDYAPTKCAGDATKLAKAAAKSGYEIVLAAGGDGTVSEVANGLVDTQITLGIIPLGSFMNISRMLAIPNDIEQAIQLIKIKRVIKIDIGTVTHLEGDKLTHPYYFLETAGIGLDAEFQKYFALLEKRHFQSLFPLLKAVFHPGVFSVDITTDTEKTSWQANFVTIANGPITGAALPLAPDAKLNDHRLTVVVYHLSWWNLAKYFWHLFMNKQVDRRRLHVYETKEVSITTKNPIPVHADATLFGTTPVKFAINPACLQVICGFPDSAKEASFVPHTFINP